MWASFNGGRFAMRRLLTLSTLLPGVASSPRTESQNDPAKRLVGAWRLVSVEGTSPVFHFAFDHPRGLIIYDPSGRMSVQQANVGDRKAFTNGPAAGTVEEKAAAFDSYGGRGFLAGGSLTSRHWLRM
jgi:hypothetical protein